MDDFVFFKNIDEALDKQELIRFNIEQIEQSKEWLKHKEQHKDAKLEFMGASKLDEEEGIAHFTEEVKQVSKERGYVPLHESSPNVSYVQGSDDGGQMFYAGCPCGAIFLKQLYGIDLDNHSSSKAPNYKTNDPESKVGSYKDRNAYIKPSGIGPDSNYSNSMGQYK